MVSIDRPYVKLWLSRTHIFKSFSLHPVRDLTLQMSVQNNGGESF
jgi:hypothetical protein